MENFLGALRVQCTADVQPAQASLRGLRTVKMENFLGGDGVDVLEMRSAASRCPPRRSTYRNAKQVSLFARAAPAAPSLLGAPSRGPSIKRPRHERESPTLPLGFRHKAGQALESKGMTVFHNIPYNTTETIVGLQPAGIMENEGATVRCDKPLKTLDCGSWFRRQKAGKDRSRNVFRVFNTPLA